MKTKLISAAVFAAAAMASQFAHAADGLITFNGAVSAQTCTINAGTGDIDVTLPTVSASALASAGQSAGRTPFDIALTACTPTPGATAHAYFEGSGLTNAATGNLTVTGGASNVELTVLNGDMSKVAMGSADAAQNSLPVDISSGNGTLKYFAEYMATGAATAGGANSMVQYSIVYQ